MLDALLPRVSNVGCLGLQKIIHAILLKYPRQAMWTVVGLTKSRVGVRKIRALQMTRSAMKADPDASSILTVASSLFEVRRVPAQARR